MQTPKQQTKSLDNLNLKETLNMAHLGCDVLFNNTEYKVNGQPFGKFISTIFSSLNQKQKANMTVMFKKLGLDFEQTLDFYNLVCMNDPLANQELLTRTSLISTYPVELKKILSTLPKIENYTSPSNKKFSVYDTNKNLMGHFSIFNNVFFKSSCLKPHQYWVSHQHIPQLIKNAFIAAEDNNFYQHRGISIPALLRSSFSSLGGKLQGGSTITQQTLKNLFLKCNKEKNISDKISRKLKEFLMVSKFEETLSKQQIIELYLNIIYFGNGAYGIQAAAKKYFNLKLAQLKLYQIAMLAALPNSPSNLSKSREKSYKKLSNRAIYVLKQMQRAGHITLEQKNSAVKKIVPLQYFPIKNNGNNKHYIKVVKGFLKDKISATSLPNDIVIETQLIPQFQILTNEALIEGLIQYEIKNKKYKITAIANTAGPFKLTDPSSWTQHLKSDTAIAPASSWKKIQVIKINKNIITVGHQDGSTSILEDSKQRTPPIQLGDIYFCTQIKTTCHLRSPAKVAGAAIVMDIQNGAIIAMASSSRSQNWAMHAIRQPGSTIKPFIYLHALNQGLAPNHILADSPINFTINESKTWSPQNYSNKVLNGYRTIRFGLENSNNIMTAHLLQLLNEETPRIPLNEMIKLTQEFGIYCFDGDHNCIKNFGKMNNHFSFILGSVETNLLRMATAYAQIANGGYYLRPSFIKRISSSIDEYTFYENDTLASFTNQKMDISDESLFQLKSILQGVVKRGTAKRLKKYSPYIAGKTGTSNKQMDAWFISFSSSLVYAVWVGYPLPKNLGKGQTGGSVALPIAQKIIEESFQDKFLEKMKSNNTRYYLHLPLLENKPTNIQKTYTNKYFGCFYDNQAESPDAITEYIDIRYYKQHIPCKKLQVVQ